MSDKSFSNVDQLSYRIRDDGGIDLEQDLGGGDVERVFLHRIHLRLLLEETGHLLQPTPADELTKRLARQLCEIRRELADECNRSHSLEMTFEKLNAYCGCIPDAIFPFDMFEDESTEIKPIQQIAPDGKPSPKASTAPEFSLQYSH